MLPRSGKNLEFSTISFLQPCIKTGLTAFHLQMNYNGIPILTAFMQTANDNMGIPCDRFVKNKYIHEIQLYHCFVCNYPVYTGG
jgi:hypothetical protein